MRQTGRESEEMEKSGKSLRPVTHHIVEAYTPALKKDLAREPVDKGKPELEDKERG